MSGQKAAASTLSVQSATAACASRGSLAEGPYNVSVAATWALSQLARVYRLAKPMQRVSSAWVAAALAPGSHAALDDVAISVRAVLVPKFVREASAGGGAPAAEDAAATSSAILEVRLLARETGDAAESAWVDQMKTQLKSRGSLPGRGSSGGAGDGDDAQRQQPNQERQTLPSQTAEFDERTSTYFATTELPAVMLSPAAVVSSGVEDSAVVDFGVAFTFRVFVKRSRLAAVADESGGATVRDDQEGENDVGPTPSSGIETSSVASAMKGMFETVGGLWGAMSPSLARSTADDDDAAAAAAAADTAVGSTSDNNHAADDGDNTDAHSADAARAHGRDRESQGRGAESAAQSAPAVPARPPVPPTLSEALPSAERALQRWVRWCVSAAREAAPATAAHGIALLREFDGVVDVLSKCEPDGGGGGVSPSCDAQTLYLVSVVSHGAVAAACAMSPAEVWAASSSAHAPPTSDGVQLADKHDAFASARERDLAAAVAAHASPLLAHFAAAIAQHSVVSVEHGAQFRPLMRAQGWGRWLRAASHILRGTDHSASLTSSTLSRATSDQVERWTASLTERQRQVIQSPPIVTDERRDRAKSVAQQPSLSSATANNNAAPVVGDSGAVADTSSAPGGADTASNQQVTAPASTSRHVAAAAAAAAAAADDDCYACVADEETRRREAQFRGHWGMFPCGGESGGDLLALLPQRVSRIGHKCLVEGRHVSGADPRAHADKNSSCDACLTALGGAAATLSLYMSRVVVLGEDLIRAPRASDVASRGAGAADAQSLRLAVASARAALEPLRSASGDALGAADAACWGASVVAALERSASGAITAGSLMRRVESVLAQLSAAEHASSALAGN